MSEAEKESDKRRKWKVLRDGLLNGHHNQLRDTTEIENQLDIDGFYGEDGIQRWIDKFTKEAKGDLYTPYK